MKTTSQNSALKKFQENLQFCCCFNWKYKSKYTICPGVKTTDLMKPRKLFLCSIKLSLVEIIVEPIKSKIIVESIKFSSKYFLVKRIAPFWEVFQRQIMKHVQYIQNMTFIGFKKHHLFVFPYSNSLKRSWLFEINEWKLSYDLCTFSGKWHLLFTWYKLNIENRLIDD